MLKERTLINQCEILVNGDIQVRLANEIYDDSITPVKGETAVYDGKELITAAVAPITDVRSKSYHRYVISSNDETPADVQAFLDNSKA